MRAIALKRQAQKALDELTEEKVRVAMDFIDYLKSKEEMEATLEILSSQELLEQIQAAERSLKRGAKTDFISWDNVGREV
jgi:arginine utilization protein RocB